MYAQSARWNNFPCSVTVTSGGTERLGTLWLDRSFGEWVMVTVAAQPTIRKTATAADDIQTARVIGGLLSRVSGTAFPASKHRREVVPSVQCDHDQMTRHEGYETAHREEV
jgi:hypothetical protein